MNLFLMALLRSLEAGIIDLLRNEIAKLAA
jgi:hypothetical protein